MTAAHLASTGVSRAAVLSSVRFGCESRIGIWIFKVFSLLDGFRIVSGEFIFSLTEYAKIEQFIAVRYYRCVCLCLCISAFVRTVEILLNFEIADEETVMKR